MFMKSIVRVIFVMSIILLSISGCSKEESKISEMSNIISVLKNNEEQQKKEIEKLILEKNNLLDEKSLYDRSFYEEDVSLTNFTRFSKEKQNLKVYAYDDSANIGTIRINQLVRILAIGYNDNREEWALIEVLDDIHPSKYGYVKVDTLEVKEYKPYISNNKESIDGICLGDHITKVFSKFGEQYTIYKSEHGMTYGYDNTYFIVDMISLTINELIVTKRGHKTVEGFQVGDNAKDVVEHYKKLYKMNENETLYPEYPELIFNLGDDYIIQFDIDTDDLIDSSIIKRIILRNIYFGEY